MALTRVPTGIKGFDKIVDGGFPRGSAVAVVGTPGSGKTIFSLEFLWRGAEKGERGLYISFKQDANSLRNQGRQFGWWVEEAEQKGLIKIFKTDDLDLIATILKIEQQVKTFRPQRVVIDSISDLLDYLPTVNNLKKLGVVHDSTKGSVLSVRPKDAINRIAAVFIDRMKNLGPTTLFITDAPQEGENLTKDGITEFACDGILILHSTVGDESLNTLNVPKMRLTKVRRGIYNFEFTPKGIEVKSEG